MKYKLITILESMYEYILLYPYFPRLKPNYRFIKVIYSRIVVFIYFSASVTVFANCFFHPSNTKRKKKQSHHSLQNDNVKKKNE